MQDKTLKLHPMTRLENIVISWTNCSRTVANTVVNEILSENERMENENKK
jgi:hypothetical protein